MSCGMDCFGGAGKEEMGRLELVDGWPLCGEWRRGV